MREVLPPSDARELMVDYADRLRSLPAFGEPTLRMYEIYGQIQDQTRPVMYRTDRGLRELAVELNMSRRELKALFIGKRVLDVGCGEGVLSAELAGLKGTEVTALDEDPSMLDHIRESGNLRAVLGSGYSIAEAVGDEKFDVVVAAVSTCVWASNGDEKRASITSPLDVCETGGKAITVPVIASIELKELCRENLLNNVRCHDVHGNGVSRESLEALIRVGDWLDVVAIDTLLKKEARGVTDVTFVSSAYNARRRRIGGDGPIIQRYSAIADVL